MGNRAKRKYFGVVAGSAYSLPATTANTSGAITKSSRSTNPRLCLPCTVPVHQPEVVSKPNILNNRLPSEGHVHYSASAALHSCDDRPTGTALAPPRALSSASSTPAKAESQATLAVILISCGPSGTLLNVSSLPKQLFVSRLTYSTTSDDVKPTILYYYYYV